MISVEYTITDLNQLIYNFAFDYLKKKYVKVSSKNITTGVVTNYTYGVHYVVVDKTIELLQSVGAVGDVLRIIRETSTSEQIVSWNDASILKASDMSLAQLQQLHILEEYSEYMSTASISLDVNGQYDAKNSRIVNLATPQDSTDAVNRGYIDSFIGTLTDAQTSATLAQSWAVGDIISRPEGSSKYWAEKSKSYSEQANGVSYITINEATGYGIISGGNVTVSAMIATVNKLIAHMPDGLRYDVSQATFTIPTTDVTNPRIDLLYLSSTGVITYVAGTATSTPSVPPLPSGALSLATISVLANATTGTVTDTRVFKTRYQNTGIVNVKDFGAVGDGITDDTAAIQKAINNCNKLIIPATSNGYLITSTLQLHGGLTIVGNGYSYIRCTASTLFNIPSGTKMLTIKDLYVFGNGTNTFMTGLGISTNESTQINKVTIQDCWISNFYKGFVFKNIRRSNFIGLLMTVNKGFLFQEKSAENNISKCWLLKSGTSDGSYGLKSISDDDNLTNTKYPEGIVITDTLFNYFDYGIWYYDIYVSFIKGCQLDCNIALYMDYNIRNEEVNFSDSWVGPTVTSSTTKRGIYFSPTSAKAPKIYRCSINNVFFDNVNNDSIYCGPWARNINIRGCSGIGTSTSRFLVTINQNQNITVDDVVLDYYPYGVAIGGEGLNNSLSNIRFLTNRPATPYSYAYAVNITNCDGYYNNKSVNIPLNSSYTQGTVLATSGNMYCGRGIYEVNAYLQTTVTTAGNLQFTAPSGAVQLGYSPFRAVNTSDKCYNFTQKFYIPDDIIGTFTLKSITDTTYAVGTISDYHSQFIVTKIS